MNKRTKKLLLFLICLIAVFLTAFIGGLFTSSETGSVWYNENKPSLTPPNYIFPIVWNILFLLIAISLYTSLVKSKERRKVIVLYSINLIVNLLWSLIFFKFKNPLIAFIDLTLLWLSILFLIIYNWRTNRTSSYLLLPYLLWVSFAGILNFLFI